MSKVHDGAMLLMVLRSVDCSSNGGNALRRARELAFERAAD